MDTGLLKHLHTLRLVNWCESTHSDLLSYLLQNSAQSLRHLEININEKGAFSVGGKLSILKQNPFLKTLILGNKYQDIVFTDLDTLLVFRELDTLKLYQQNMQGREYCFPLSTQSELSVFLDQNLVKHFPKLKTLHVFSPF